MKTTGITSNKLNNLSLWVLTLLRIAIGWHFLYEGIVKLTTSGWTSASYLLESRWIFAGLFHWMAAHPGVLQVVDVVNIWGLILVGLGLMLGFLSRYATIGGIVLLAFYYIANPPFISATGAYLEGHYVWIDKNLIELMALIVLLVIPTSRFIGMDGLLKVIRLKVHRPKPDPVPVDKTGRGPASDDGGPNGRRDMLRHLATLPVLGAFTYAAIRKQKWDSFEERVLQANANQPDSSSGATIKSFSFSSLKDLKGTIPKGKIGDLELSRMIAGGNLMGGWAHSRDLMYVNKLVKAYHHDQ